MAHSATRITPAPRPPALAALSRRTQSACRTDRHDEPSSPIADTPTSFTGQAIRTTWRLCTADDRIAGSTGLFMSERDGFCREATTDSACSTTSTASPEGRYPDTRVPGRWVPRRARCVRPSTVGACSSGLRPDDGRQLAGLCHQHPMQVAPDQDPFLGEVSRAQPYGYRIRHEDEKKRPAISMRILKTPR